MKRLLNMKYLVILGLALLLSIAPTSWRTLENVPFCIQSAGCNGAMEPKGTVTERQHGYPLTYKRTSTFVPNNNDQNSPKYVGYAEASTEQQRLNLLNIAINTVFWYALITSIARLLPAKKPKPQPANTPQDQA